MKIRVVTEDFDYHDYLFHMKHFEEYMNDSRCAKEVSDLKKASSAFEIKYNMIADQLAMSKAGKANSTDDIVGYMKDKHTAVKYDKQNHDFVVYNYNSPRYKTITLHKKTLEQYEHIRDRDMLSELPENMN